MVFINNLSFLLKGSKYDIIEKVYVEQFRMMQKCILSDVTYLILPVIVVVDDVVVDDVVVDDVGRGVGQGHR